MAYDTHLEARIDLLSLNWPGLGKKAMFGGKGYLMRAHMAFGIIRDHLIVRCGPARYADCLAQVDVVEFDITGKPMTGWVMIRPAGIESDAALLSWLECGRDFAASLPPK
jgi:hypothetical protein